MHHHHLASTTSTHTDLISSSLSRGVGGVLAAAAASLIGDEEFSWAPQSDSGRRNLATCDFSRELCRAWQRLCWWHRRFFVSWKTCDDGQFSVGLSENVLWCCGQSIGSSAMQSARTRSRKPHRELWRLPTSAGSDENFLNTSELLRGCRSTVDLTAWDESATEAGPEPADADADGDLYIELSSESVLHSSENSNLVFNLNNKETMYEMQCSLHVCGGKNLIA